MMKTRLLPAFFALLPALLLAQWQPTYGPKGGSAEDLAANSTHVFAATSAGLFRSSDAGLSWQHCPVGEPYSARLLAVRGAEIFALGNTGTGSLLSRLWRSTDSGASWQACAVPPSLFGGSPQFGGLAIGSGAVLVADYDTIFRSTNGGQTWEGLTNLPPGNYLHSNSLTGDAQGRIWVNKYPLAYRSMDNGDSWQALPAGPTGFQNNGRYFIDSETALFYNIIDEKLYATANDGQTWQAADDKFHYQSSFARIDGSIYGSFQYDSLRRSDDGGLSWTKLYSPGCRPGDNLTSIGSTLVSSSDDRDLKRSDDLGQTWGLCDADLFSGGTAMAADGGTVMGFYRYRGFSRFDAATGNWDTAPVLPVNWWQAAMAPGGNGKWYALCLPGVFNGGNFFKSTDDGLTWVNLNNNDLEGSNINNRLEKAGNRLFTWVEEDFEANPLVSNNDGLSWAELPSPGGTGGYDFAVLDGRTFLGRDSSLLRSDNFGVSWVESSAGIEFDPAAGSFFNSVAQLDKAGGLLFCAVGDPFGLEPRRPFISFDKGENWQKFDLPPTGPIWPDHVFHSPMMIGGTLVATVNGKCFASPDSGKVWLPFHEGLGGGLADGLLQANGWLYTNAFGQTWRRPIGDLGFEKTTGHAFLDENHDGLWDPAEPPAPLTKILLKNSQTTALAGPDGAFTTYGHFAPADTMRAVHPIKYATTEPPFRLLTGAADGQDFAIQLTPNIRDLSVEAVALTRPRPGFENSYSFWVKNLGTTAADGSLTIALDPAAELVSADPPADWSSAGGDSLSWALAPLALLESRFFKLTLKTPVSQPLGSFFTQKASVTPTAGDENPSDNLFERKDIVVGSFDPNDKAVEPSPFTTADLAAGQPLTYTVRFQNTGTFEAETVRITDLLEEGLDLSTFELLAASHPVEVSLAGRQLQFLFKNIHLPDSLSDEPGSHGFVRFSIRPAKNWPPGSAIGNQAAIYFDFNEPVITNVARLLLTPVLSVFAPGAPPVAGELEVFPNPTAGEATFFAKTDRPARAELFVFDQKGVLIKKQAAETGRPQTVRLDGLPTGVYWLAVRAEMGVWVAAVARH